VIPRILTIAGSDSGGGAGIQADLKTITALGGFGTSAITALTAQNTLGVRAVHPVEPAFVAAQIDAVAEDIGVDAAKTGMLAERAVVEAVADAVRRHAIRPLVVDPVMVAKSGDALLEPEAVGALRELILPLATVVTPNLAEAAELAGRPVADRDDMREAAARLLDLGPEWVLVKGGHLPGDPVDVLCHGDECRELRRPRVETRSTHGTGCTYSAAIATMLGRGLPLLEAVERARDALQAALEAGLDLGKGAAPLGHGALFGR
jgi:hydroxymethylpyrimidine kinase/phosphomethylpyrimidine kinase